MARPRMIDQEDVLDAAEVVVGRDGAAHMTLDAVAAEAGISKGSVVYDFGSKQNLIRAVIERRIRLEEEKIRAEVKRLGAVSSAEIRGRIAAAEGLEDDDTKAVAINLCSVLAQDAELRNRMQEFYRNQIGAVLKDAKNDRNATTAFLAVEGFKMLEYMSFFWWSAKERKTILKDIATLAQTDTLLEEK